MKMKKQNKNKWNKERPVLQESKNLSEAEHCKIAIEEIEQFKKLVKGHKKLIKAIGEL